MILRFVTTLTVLALSTAAIAATPVTESKLRGVWIEKGGDTVYSFGKNHEFEFRYVNSATKKVESELGAWEFGLGMCELGKARGNIFTHVGTQRCCHNAYFLGTNLVLVSLAPQYGACSDRVLVREPAKAQTRQQSEHIEYFRENLQPVQ